MKKKAEITAINPTAIIGTLLHYYSKEKGSDEILGYLEASLDMLPEIERPHVERCVSDELAGAIAALVALICTNKSKAALVMVTNVTDKKHHTTILSNVMEVLKKLGYLSKEVEIVGKETTRAYFCMSRYNSAVSNGQVFPAKTEEMLTVRSLNKKLANKVCVNKCGKSCNFYNKCKFQTLMENLQTGAIQVQVYDVRQYRSALNSNKLPKSRITVYTPDGRRVINEREGCVLTERELISLAYDCEKYCSTLRRKKLYVAERASVIRSCARSLYAMATGEMDEKTARKLLTAILNNMSEIRGECFKELNKPDRKALNKRINSTIQRITFLLKSEIDVTHKNQGKRALVSA